ncbi:TIGR02453 family protein [Fimbriiglobus ruber]|uniref:TIGR02453 family protein n=1 Tax=Fimbriiglobus ruber TaxID=1908690 RepID=A0A225D9M9_9BACT|nr:TIGR02453 family protein [Fimbriiglobus ruber]OWK38271.1 hypothetical protein FRUB_07391 [Fimbriiglobus ruber]
MPGRFTGFGADSYAFLRGLAESQSRDWFQRNRETYETHLRGPLGDLVEHVAAVYKKKKIPLIGTREKSLFRIYRNLRFSKDKTPYKTFVSAIWSRDGGRGSDGIIYVHIDPAGSFLAAGHYQSEPPVLAALRGAIRDNPAGFRKMIAALAKKDLVMKRDDVASRVPRGFEDVEADDLKDALKLKSFIVSRPVDEDEVRTPDFVDTVLTFTTDVMPLLKFGWTATADLTPTTPPDGPADD